MSTLLIVVDGSTRSESAVRSVIRQAGLGQVGTVHLVNVQPLLGAYIGRFVGTGAIRDFQREQGERELAGARRLLDEAGVPCRAHVYAGEAAETIARAAEELGATEIVIGADGLGFFGSLNLHSLISRVIRRSNVPVSVVKSGAAEIEAAAGNKPAWQLRTTH
jgi:nucleotide-binding universal stress UspA family protein